MAQYLPFAKSAAFVALIIVLVLTVIMTFAPPNKSPLYRIGASLFLISVIVALGIGAFVLLALLFPR